MIHEAVAAARAAVEAASRVCRAVSARGDAIRTLAKDDKSPVTVADFASQAVATRVLGDHLGPLHLIAEEQGAFLRTAAPAYQRAVVDAVRVAWPEAHLDDVLGALRPRHDPDARGFWTLDPIDGTKGFLRGHQYCVSLAWIDGGSPAVGVLGCPHLSADPARPVDRADRVGSSYYAIRGQGSYGVAGTDADARGQRLEVAVHEGPLVICAPLEEAHADREGTDALARGLGAGVTTLRLDSQCKYAVVARGQAGLYLRLPRDAHHVERIWDHAAGALVVAEAGGAVSDLDGRPLDFGRGVGLSANRGILCGHPRAHARALEVLRS